MTVLQIIAAIIIAGLLIYFLKDVIRHAIARGGSVKWIIVRVVIWLLIFGVILGINLLINSDWVPGRWLFSISY